MIIILLTTILIASLYTALFFYTRSEKRYVWYRNYFVKKYKKILTDGTDGKTDDKSIEIKELIREVE